MIPNLTRIVDESPVVRQPCPAGWSYDGCFGHDNEFLASCYRNKGMGLVVLLSLSTLDGGARFVHCSLSRRSRLPSWQDVKVVKDTFLGEDSEAFHVLPKKDDYINLCPFCLHLWMPAETETE